MLMRFVKWALMVVALCTATLAAGALIPYPGRAPVNDSAERFRIIVAANPIHTDILIPINNQVRQRFSFLSDEGGVFFRPGARWLVVGWGGRSFYTETPRWADLKPLPVIKSLTSDASVLHLDIAGDVADADPTLRSFQIDADAFNRLLDFIDGSFVRTHGRPVALTGAAYGANDQFYEAKGRFNFLVGCNTWTAEGLRIAGVRTGLWTPLPITLFWSLGLHN